MIQEQDRERIFAITNYAWSGVYSDDHTAADVLRVDCVKLTRPSPFGGLSTHVDDTYFHWLVFLGTDGKDPCRGVAVATDDPGERAILHRNTDAPRVLESYDDYRDTEMERPPHCDPRVLHAFGECKVCDEHARSAQFARKVQGVSFTGQTGGRWPCPGDVARPNKSNQVWGGNRPWKGEV